MKKMLLTSFGDSEDFLHKCWAALIIVTNEIQFPYKYEVFKLYITEFFYLLCLHLHVVLV